MNTQHASPTNRLAGASSPYLRQHATNPVHWQPWDATALAQARDSDTPILLSVGYSACHWCHVMAHECFEDPAIAAVMNNGFVCIKLDREERPDIDHVYQLAHQAMAGRGGGWPLTAFLDPQDLAPFFIGTYFPPTPRHGLPAFPELLVRVRAYFDAHRDDLRQQAAQLHAWLRQASIAAPGNVPDATAVQADALQRTAGRFDAQHGGNRGAPKFPRGAELEWLLDSGRDSESARAMAHATLANMAARGLQDHLGGGFFRYCVDADWTIPHFEKMLYDNAALLPAYARLAASSATDSHLRATARSAIDGIADWLARELAAPNGAFHSSLNADSEGVEGRYYLWSREQAEAALDASDYPLAAAAFGLDAPPNFEGRAWHLLRAVPTAALATRFDPAPAGVDARIAAARAALLAVRNTRVPPSRDDKILVAWNALAISGLARAARLLADARLAGMARAALAAVRDGAWLDGHLYANVAPPAARIPGFLDDHALLLDALLECLQLDFDSRDLAWAIALADTLLRDFEDREHGGFWFSTTAHVTPLARARDFTDDALPNGNGMAARGLLRLGHLLGETRYLDAAERTLRAAAPALAGYPDACPTLLRALREYAHPRAQIVIRCPPDAAATWQAAIRGEAARVRLAAGGDPLDVFVIAPDTVDLPGILAARRMRDGRATAWLCEGARCLAPCESPVALAAALDDVFGAA